MLNYATGNIYEIDSNNKLIFKNAETDFKGNKSTILINILQKGIDAAETYTLNLVGAEKDDYNVFIDSFSEGRIDVFDLDTIGKVSTALQGAIIGHFLNEIQELENYDLADKSIIEAAFSLAHNNSLEIEAKIFGELINVEGLNKRIDYPTGAAENGYQNIVYQYGELYKFQFKQGAKSTIKETMIDVGGVKIKGNEIITVPTGELKSIRKL